MAVHLHRMRRGDHALEERREEFLRAQQERWAEERAKVSPLGVLALVAILGLAALWATGMLPALLIQLLLGGS